VAVQRDADEQAGLDTEAERSALWSEVRIDPVEIALPKGVGYTRRAYRPIDDVTPTDVSEREQDEFFERPRPTDRDEVNEFDDEYDDLDEVDETDDEHDTDLDDEETDED